MKKVIKILNELLRKGLIKDYAIGGGIATIFYVEPFLTYDVDVFIRLPKKKKMQKIISLSPIFTYLENKGYPWSGEHILIEGVPVQFIPVDTLEEEAVRNAKKIEHEGVTAKVLTPEYLILILLRAGRKKDIGKIEKLLSQASINIKKLKRDLSRHGLTGKFKPFLREGEYEKK